MKKDTKIRNRYFCGILYEEDENFEKYMNYIKSHYLEVTYIRHDRDIIENSDNEELKKPHIHILFKVGENARTLKAIAEEIRNTKQLLARLQQESNVNVFYTSK